MKWVTDITGRFLRRPHYLPDELDAECEYIISSFLKDRHGRIEFPIRTDDLTVLIERDVADLDIYADLLEEGNETEGETEFFKNEKPSVKISKALSEDPRMENRFRTTLTHEYGHVKFHGFLFSVEEAPSLFETKSAAQSKKCKRENIVGARSVDWMEWQAGFACGALLMPGSAFNSEIQGFREEKRIASGLISESSEDGHGLIVRVSRAFQVSRDAARVRLLQRNVLSAAAALVWKYFSRKRNSVTRRNSAIILFRLEKGECDGSEGGQAFSLDGNNDKTGTALAFSSVWSETDGRATILCSRHFTLTYRWS